VTREPVHRHKQQVKQHGQPNTLTPQPSHNLPTLFVSQIAQFELDKKSNLEENFTPN
jgi:hypothetical protein